MIERLPSPPETAGQIPSPIFHLCQDIARTPDQFLGVTPLGKFQRLRDLLASTTYFGISRLHVAYFSQSELASQEASVRLEMSRVHRPGKPNRLGDEASGSFKVTHLDREFSRPEADYAHLIGPPLPSCY